MTAYNAYLDGSMKNHIPDDAELQRGFDTLPDIPQNK